MEDNLTLMLEMQRQLQLKMPPPNRVPGDLRGDERATFIIWNAYALDDEIHEAIAEMGWKPWATSRHLNPLPMLKEMVDGWHFFMNILLVIAGEMGWSTSEMATEFTKLYISKNAVNAARQEEGYDGVSSKCPYCHRELSDLDPLAVKWQEAINNKVMIFCSKEHGQLFMEARDGR